MKTALITAVSLTFNVMLVALLSRTPRPAVAGVQRNAGPIPSVPAAAVRQEAAPKGSDPLRSSPPPLHWSVIESSDLAVYASNLRAIGCPPAIIRDVIVGRADALFARKVDEMVDASEGRFWEIVKDRERFEAFVEEKSGQLREWEKERDELLEQVGAGMKFPPSGMDAVDEFTRITKRRQSLDFLPAETQEQILALDAKYDRLREEAAVSNIDLKPEELRAEHSRLERERMSEMRRMLTAEELSEHNLRNSPVADIRFGLGDFTASEEEIREIVRIREAERKGAQSRDGVSPEEGARQISSLLGPDRFEVFKRSQNREFQQLSRLGERLNLSPETVASAYEARILAEKRIAEVEAQRGLSEAARNSALARIRAETENSLSDTLGPQAFAAVRMGWQDWLRNPGR